MGLKAVKNMTIEEVEREIKQTNDDLGHPYWKDHPKHQAAVERMTALFKRKFPPDKLKPPLLSRSPLGDLVNFLNIDFESPSAWERWKIYRSLSTEKIDRSDELRKAWDLQSEIKNDLSPIADWRGIPKELFAYDERWFDLCEKLNEMNFRRHWQVDIEALAERKDFFIPRFKSWNLPEGYRQNWYALVGRLLETGEIERLRECPTCKIFFEARDKRQVFCQTRGTKCKDDYHNRETGAERKQKSRIKRIIEAEERISEEKRKKEKAPGR
jgi:hypothetical protein